jgi:hypothetical protein
MWSLVGTTSRILAQKLSASLRLMIRSLFSLFQFLLDFPKQRMHIIHFHPSVLLTSHLSSSHIVVFSQVASPN